MLTFITVIGAALLGYVVYLISGVGIAIMAFVGILLLMYVIAMWLSQINENIIAFHNIQCSMHRGTREIYKEHK